MANVNMPTADELLEAGVHFGHTTSRWHPKMEPFLYGKRGGVHLIDVAKTRTQLEKAAQFAQEVAASGKSVLFIGVKPLARAVVKEAAIRADSPYVVNRWVGGMLTNWPAVSNMINRMKKIEDDKASGRIEKYTKREQLLFAEEYANLEETVGGIRPLNGKPGAVFIIDAKYDKTALNEARKLNIPVIAIADSNINPTKIDHVIPANDDALKSVTMITNVIADAVQTGKEKPVHPAA